MFIEKRLLDKVSFGSQSGFEFRTDIKQMRNGFESRLSEWSEPLQPLNVIFRLLSLDEKETFEDAFIVCRGRAAGFRFRNPLNYRAVNQPLGFGNGGEQTLQLRKTSSFLESASYPIKKPVAESVQIFADGAPIAATTDGSTGLVTFSALLGAAITWSGHFDTPVRFDSDKLLWTYETKAGGDCQNGGREPRVTTDVGLQEIRL